MNEQETEVSTVTFSITISHEVNELLKIVAKRNHWSKHGLINYILDEFVFNLEQ